MSMAKAIDEHTLPTDTPMYILTIIYLLYRTRVFTYYSTYDTMVIYDSVVKGG